MYLNTWNRTLYHTRHSRSEEHTRNVKIVKKLEQRVLVSVGPVVSPNLNFAYAGRGNFKPAPLDARSIWIDDDQLLDDVLLFAFSVCAELLFAQTLRTVQSVNSFQNHSVTSTFLWRFYSNLPMITAIRCNCLSERIRNVNDGSRLVVCVSPILRHRDVHLTVAHVSLFVGSWSGQNIIFASLCLLSEAKCWQHSSNISSHPSTYNLSCRPQERRNARICGQ